MSENVLTPGPWEWRKIGKDWVLWGAHGHRPIVLDHGQVRGQRGNHFRVRNTELCVMIPFYPEHPDARLLASAPDLLDSVRAILFQITQGKVLERDACIAQAREAFIKAGGKP